MSTMLPAVIMFSLGHVAAYRGHYLIGALTIVLMFLLCYNYDSQTEN